jgi:hypothetical protein
MRLIQQRITTGSEAGCSIVVVGLVASQVAGSSCGLSASPLRPFLLDDTFAVVDDLAPSRARVYPAHATAFRAFEVRRQNVRPFPVGKASSGTVALSQHWRRGSRSGGRFLSMAGHQSRCALNKRTPRGSRQECERNYSEPKTQKEPRMPPHGCSPNSSDLKLIELCPRRDQFSYPARGFAST